MSYNFISNADKADSIWGMLAMSLTTLYGRGDAPSFGVGLLFAIVWAIGASLWSDERRSALITLGGSAAIWLAFTLYYAISLRGVATRQPTDIFEMIDTVDLLGAVLTGFVTWTLALMMTAALCLAPTWPRTWFGKWGGAFAAPVLFAAAIVFGYFTNTQIIQADMSLKLAAPWERQKRWDVVIPLYQHALKLAPDEDQYYLHLAQAYLGAANASQDRVEQETILNVALGELRRAQALNPLNPDHSANQARLLQRWSRTTTDPNEASVRIGNADKQYAAALVLSPNNVSLWNEWARFDFTIRKDTASAQTKLAESLKLDDSFNETYLTLGDLWAQIGSEKSDPSEEKDAYAQAASYYQQAIVAEANKRGTPPSLPARLGLATAQQRLEHWDEAIAAYEDVLSLAGQEYNVWSAYNALAEIYLAKGDKTAALEWADKALTEAPEGDKAVVQALIERIGR
jgi:tetratricopeptide (TPR) repeat protein